MATQQDTNKQQEQTKEQTKASTPQSRQPDQQAKTNEPSRAKETGLAPRRNGGSMTRADRWGPLARLHDEFDRLFDQFSRGMMGMPSGRWDMNWGIDMQEDDKNVIVRAEAPGFEAEDFDIRVHGDRLVMCACRSSEEEEEGTRGWRRDEFAETLMLPAEIDADKVKASYRNGVLTVTLPKTEQSQSKRIRVE